MAFVFGMVCFCLSFGPAFPLYKVLYDLFPPMAAVPILDEQRKRELAPDRAVDPAPNRHSATAVALPWKPVSARRVNH
jgi:hypothetical protein